MPHVSDFDEIIFFVVVLNKYRLIPLFCFVTGCGHCKKAKPEYATAAEAFKDDPRIELAAVDCTKHNSVCSAYSVKGFPTFKYFSYLKTVRDYDGGRTVSLNEIQLRCKSEKKILKLILIQQSVDFIKFLSDPDAPTEKPKSTGFGTYPGSDSVLTLTDDNFHDQIKKNDKLLVMFYAPCKQKKTKHLLRLSVCKAKINKN